MSQCNPKCPFCDKAPREGDDVLKFDWEHFVSQGNKIAIAPYSEPSSKTQDGGQALFDQLFSKRTDFFDKPGPTYRAPRQADRFMWIHKACVEKAFEIMRSIQLKVQS